MACDIMRLSVSVLCISILVCQCVYSKRIPWWALKIAQDQGPNACVVEEIADTNKRYWTECKYWVDREICGQKTVIRYECCEGYERVGNEEGCTGVKPLRSVLDTASDLGATEFVKWLRDAGFTEELTREGSHTLFAPTNEALSKVNKDVLKQLELYANSNKNPILQYHIVSGKHRTTNINRNLILDTKLQGKNLRLNNYVNGVVTVNCGPIVRKDQLATNGIVHLIDHVLDPATTSSKSVIDLIIQDGRFEELSKAIDQSGLLSQLRVEEQTLTVFAPSDEAFQGIPTARLTKIMNDREARKALVQNHILPHPVCTAAIHKKFKMRTLSKDKITMTCSPKKAYVESQSLSGESVLASNGVVHVINHVLLPDRARSLTELLESRGLHTFSSLVNASGLYETLSDFGDYTLFVPSEEAFQRFGRKEVQALRRNKELMRQFVLFHGTQGRIKTNAITNNQVMMSLDEENALRLQVYRSGIGVETGRIEQGDIEGQNGVLHVISNVLLPANKSAGDTLRYDGQHTIFLGAMERAMRYDPSLRELASSASTRRAYTFLAPSDAAFNELSKQDRNRIQTDDKYVAKLVKNHILDGIVSSLSFKKRLHYKLPTKLHRVSITKYHKGFKINGVAVKERDADIVTTNGLVHLTNKVLLP